jgi:hypothetical protein
MHKNDFLATKKGIEIQETFGWKSQISTMDHKNLDENSIKIGLKVILHPKCGCM